MMQCMMIKKKSQRQPSPAQLEKLANREPDLINALIAYFVFEWKYIVVQEPMHGKDQNGVVCLVPDYIGMWGVDACIQSLRDSPRERTSDEPGGLSRWLEKIST